MEQAEQFVFLDGFAVYAFGCSQGGFPVADAFFDVGAADLDGKVGRVDFGSQAGDECVFDGVFEFADVSGPAVVVDHAHGVAVDVGDLFPGFFVEFSNKVVDKGLNVFAAVSQGCQVDGEDVEAVEEVFAEFSLFDAFAQVSVCGGHDADVDFSGLGVANAFDFAFLDDAEEFYLDILGDFADFVEKDGAAIGAFESSDVVFDGAGKRAAYVAEQFGFDEGFAECGAVDGDEGLIGPVAVVVDGACDEFFSGSGFAADEDAGCGCGGQFDEGEDLLHGGASADDVVEFVAVADFAAQVEYLFLEVSDGGDVGHGDDGAEAFVAGPLHEPGAGDDGDGLAVFSGDGDFGAVEAACGEQAADAAGAWFSDGFFPGETGEPLHAAVPSADGPVGVDDEYAVGHCLED